MNYSVEEYKKDIDKNGIEEVWLHILEYCKYSKNDLLNISNFGLLYEIGLAHINKENKKENGIYYTPSDVADTLTDYLMGLKGDNICDVCCGTGNLVLSYLEKLGYDKARELIKKGRLYLYDMDELALAICKQSIGIIYGTDCLEYINCICGDFLDKNIHLPDNSRVISDPPYFKITKIEKTWENSQIIKDTKELYSAFMEKILKESSSSVMITPFSFIGIDKFYSLRELMNDYNGFILSFDNMPACIFNGQKQGVFNTNVSNSVRAAITVVENKKGVNGFKVSPLIRFTAGERSDLLKNEVLNGFIADDYQMVSDINGKYYKCFKEVLPLYKSWIDNSSLVFGDLLIKNKTEYSLSMPKTCRYYVSATRKDLERSGKHILYFNDLYDMEFAYCILNSSFSYLYWRMYDGSVTFTEGLLKSMPVFSNILSVNQKEELHNMVSDMINKEKDYLVYKKNANEMQENVKFPDEYRDKLNQFLVDVLEIDFNIRKLDRIHSNTMKI
jgi:hypothetical protein